MINHTHELEAGRLKFTFLPTGDLYSIRYNNLLINQVLSNGIDGSLNNLYLRIHQDDGTYAATPLLGIQSPSTVCFGNEAVSWTGVFESVAYEVVFRLSDDHLWFWDVTLKGNDRADLFYTQDVGLADIQAVRSNEAYTSQYIEHTIFNQEEKGYIVSSRQNQPQSGSFPYLQQGGLSRIAGFSTDGFQFFGLSYKTTNRPEALEKTTLANQKYQYEFALCALQSETIKLNGETTYTFYGLFKENHAEAVEEPFHPDHIEKAWSKSRNSVPDTSSPGQPRFSEMIGSPLITTELSETELQDLYSDRILEEEADGTLLSFFTPDYAHVVLKQKEETMERPHGHILMDGHNDRIRNDVLTTTSYMYGIFNSQVAVGNISMNKMMSNSRNPLNLIKTAGQRIYVEMEGTYRLLTMPSLFEMGLNYAKWIYKTSDEVFLVTNFIDTDGRGIQMDFQAESGKSYRCIVTSQIVMNANEYDAPFHYDEEEGSLIFKADETAASYPVHPGLRYRMSISGTDYEVVDEDFLTSGVEKGSTSLVIMALESASEWTLHLAGHLSKTPAPTKMMDFGVEKKRYRNYINQVRNHFHLSHADERINRDMEKFNALSSWYTHNMLVHFSTPHGLEQYGGAAWGTRDVSQGPFEFFLATENYQTARDIILHVYAHQYAGDGNWPQWFMFDEYSSIQQAESHGDIIVWPLKMVSDYLKTTGDYSILKEEIPYTEADTYSFTESKFSLIEHMDRQLSYMDQHFLHDTCLPSYDDGDWDDTLQPAKEQLKKYLVSSWTTALMYQAVHSLSSLLTDKDPTRAERTKKMADGIRRDYHRFINKTDVIPGFIYMEDKEHPEYMLHPQDQTTGIHYRLLPMQRSIISELFTPEEAARHYEIIKNQLTYPDGVRLMNRPATYRGGVSTHFKRAEQASNFGREIGLQYVHAHIRFIEAMAKLGKDQDVWDGLAVINPVRIQEVVPNASLRQSNAYFSSSDGAFLDRYDAQEHFHQLKDGSVPVKGGWRIYSSGPGIYMNQLINQALGVRQEKDSIVIDPVVPANMDGLHFHFELLHRPVTFIYHLNSEASMITANGNKLTLKSTSSPYRQGGWKIAKGELEPYLSSKENTIDIYL
ncbi:cellobiose phosphorylase [Bacillus sp. SB49]|uniref:GH36-type glycosyl hydrolase domain-containing protein n=1 Tax=Bacillus sp. SB49 TaxID=1071080 RepID=UPI00040E472E|nr:cellobiose phosphorylase [Bacillus sp. SB49]QHT45453.1 cellobiose phosphorylase [Bacillus sp. SB49]